MSNANVKNNHETALGVGGVSIPAGATAQVDNWESVKESGAVKAWLDQEILTVEGGGVKMPGLPDPEEAEKDKIIAELAGFGIEKTKRTSLENLRKELADAKAAE